jgi:hypothetical protein
MRVITAGARSKYQGHSCSVGGGQAERDRRELLRRAEVVGLPMTPVLTDGIISPSKTDPTWNRRPKAVGVGPDGETWAVWTSHHETARQLVTSHTTRTEPEVAFEIDTHLDCSFVQPMPDGQVLTVSSRKQHACTAQLWSVGGKLLREGDFGDALEHVLATPSGAIWVGYFDEAHGGSGPQSHGVARFNGLLEPEWLYPIGSQLPPVFDCYALNVDGEVAYVQADSEFHLVRVSGDGAADLGAVPRMGANRVLLEGGRAALIGGYGAEYDLITPVRLTRTGIAAGGEPRRLVLPNGLEFTNARTTCRGSILYAVIGSKKYRLDLNDLEFWE